MIGILLRFFCYIVGFRQSDFSLVLVQTDADLQEHSDPFYVDMDNIGNVSYEPKVHQLCFKYKKGSDDFGEAFRRKLEQNGFKLDKWKR